MQYENYSKQTIEHVLWAVCEQRVANSAFNNKAKYNRLQFVQQWGTWAGP